MADLFPNQNVGTPQHHELNEGASFSNNSSMDFFEILSSILVTIAKGEHIVQCIREVLVQDPSFTPMSLFKYLAKNDRQIRCHNLIGFLQENSLATNQKEMERLLGRVFSRYGTNKDNIQYSQFINFIYPWNTGVLREVTVNRLKNYQKIDKIQRNVRPSDSVLTAFLLLIDHEMLVEKKIEAQLADPRFPTTKQFRKVIKSIKKASQKICSTLIEQSSNHISMLELRNFIKAFMQVPQYLFVYLSRRLSMNKSGLIALQTLDNVFKKSKKTCANNKENEELMNIHREEFEKCKVSGQNIEKYEKQNNYRDQLYVELSEALNISPQRNRTPRNKSYSQNKRAEPFNRKTPAKKQSKKQRLPFLDDSQVQTPIQNLSSNYKFQRPKQKPQNEPNAPKLGKGTKAKVNESDDAKYVNRIFKEYVQIYLKGYKEIEKCKMKLVANKKIDFLSLFKSLDHGTGAINATDVRNLYVRLSGIPTNYDFELIIRRFSQQDEEWLSYSEFIEIFKPSNTNDLDAEALFLESNRMGLTKSVDLSPQNMRSLSQILYLTLDVEHCLSAVLEKLSRQQVDILFSEIACQEQQTAKGFINYQQLKKYIVERLEISANMSDTMALLKRLDRSKNGVVVKEQFLRF